MSWFTPWSVRREAQVDVPVNFASPAFKANPFPFYARLRAETPVYRTQLPTGGTIVLITRYDDVATVLRDERFIKNRMQAMTREQRANQSWFRRLTATRWFRALEKTMLHSDPPDHTRLRSLVTKAFTPGVMEQMRDRIQRLAEQLLDKAMNRRQIDLIRDYAMPIPTTVIAEMLGVPAQDRDRFNRWSNAMIESGSSTWGLINALPNALAFLRYIREIIRQRRAQPRDDLISALIRAEEAGDSLTEEELVGTAGLLLVAGHETTVNLIGNGTLALLEHAGQLERLRREPALIKSAVEELLRFTSPVEAAPERYAREDLMIAGYRIVRGEVVGAVIASANRDERQFVNPDTLDITREPNRHLSFGLGLHFCLGASLARLEGQIAINTLLRWAPDLRLAVAPTALKWRAGLITRGVKELPVTLCQRV